MREGHSTAQATIYSECGGSKLGYEKNAPWIPGRRLSPRIVQEAKLITLAQLSFHFSNVSFGEAP